ncbi:MAG: 3-oxoacyl-ACP synthase III family protein [Pseudomonadales bacterium]
MSVRVSPGRVRLLGCANRFPNRLIDNAELLQKLRQLCGFRSARQAGIIAKRLGIESRYVSRDLDTVQSKPQISTPQLASGAIELAMQRAGCKDLGYLISHTSTPHSLLPSNAAWISDEMGLANPYMELRQACTGFVNALQIAVPMLNYDASLEPLCIVGAEVGSVFFDISQDFIDTEQLINYVQMGDAASAVILDRDDGSERGIISHCFSGHIGLSRPPGFQLCGAGSRDPHCDKGLPYFQHDAKNVAAQGPLLFEKGVEAVKGMGFDPVEFDYILPHQANGHIDKMLAEHLGVARERVINDAVRWGNLGSTAIWASLTGLIESGRLQAGDRVLVLGAEATKYMYGGFIYQH